MACITPKLSAITVTDFAPVPALEGDPMFYGSGGANTCVGVNSDGVVVGYAASSAGGSRSFAYYSDVDQLVDIGTFGGWDSVATAISEGGDIVGYSQDENYYSHAYQFDGYSMNPLSGVWGESFATGINSAFEICGSAGSGAFFQNAIGTYAPPGDAANYVSWASAINDQSMITGYYFPTSSPYSHAFLWDTGSNTWTDLGTLGGSSSWGYALNSSGHVVGTSVFDDAIYTTNAFLYSNGTMTNLGSLAGVNGGSCAYGISDQDHVVGASGTLTDGSHAFIYKSGTMYDLNTLAASYLSDGTTEGFYVLEDATAIGRSADASGHYVVVGNGWYIDSELNWFRQGYILHIAD